MRFHFLAICLFALAGAGVDAQVRPVESAQSTKAIDAVRTPAIDADGYVYISGQSGNRPDGTVPDNFREETRQALENVKALVLASGLTMEHVVYLQVYMLDVGEYEVMNGVFKKYFVSTPPARAVLGVARLPQGSIQVNAVAVRDLTARKAISPANYKSDEPFSPGILTRDRLFVSAMQGRDPVSGKIPEDSAAQADFALDGLKSVVEAAGLTMKHFVFVNPYLTQKIPSRIMNERYARRFEFGNTPARATIMVTALPQNAQIEYTGVAVRDIQRRRAIRPKNMPPSPTASPCVFAGETLYCSAKSGFIPGPNGGVYAANAATQLRQTMRNQLDNLEEAEMDFSEVVSTTVYLDDLSDTEAFNKVYREYFKSPLPVQTLLQQMSSTTRSPGAEGHYPDLEQVSLIAVKRHSNH